MPSILGICAATVAAWFLAEAIGVQPIYGVSVAAVGMLSITGMIVSADAYGPIVDNAKGCAEAGHESEETIRVCDRLDAAGNTAKAITKGFAIGAAALDRAGALCRLRRDGGCRRPRPSQSLVIVGMFLGAMMPPLFSALTILVGGTQRLHDGRGDSPPVPRDPGPDRGQGQAR